MFKIEWKKKIIPEWSLISGKLFKSPAIEVRALAGVEDDGTNEDGVQLSPISDNLLDWAVVGTIRLPGGTPLDCRRIFCGTSFSWFNISIGIVSSLFPNKHINKTLY